MNYAPRIRFPWTRIAPWIARIALVSDKVIVYEHNDDPANIHCHMLIFGLTKDKDTVKNWLVECLHQTPVGTEWTFPQQYKQQPVDDGFIKYMTKGKYDPKYNKGYTPEFIAEQKALGFDGKLKKGVQKQSKQLTYYNDFVKWLYEKSEHKTPLDLTNPYTIKTAAWEYMMTNTAMPMPYELSLFKASLIKYCFDYNISLPDDMKKNLRLF